MKNIKTKIIFILFYFLISLDVNSKVRVSSNTLEGYSKRPSIVNIELANTGSYKYSDIYEAFIHSVAMLFEAYPKDTHFYFLARDAEYLYDASVLLAQNDKQILDKLHLINVSTLVSTDINLKNYLKENGLSESNLRKGRNYVFVETGFMGTVPDLIMQLFPIEFKNQFDVFLLQSDSYKYKSVKSFVEFTSARRLEKLSHYTSSGVFLKEVNNEYKVLSFMQKDNVRKEAVQIMEELKSYFTKHENIKKFEEIRQAWKSFLKSGNKDLEVNKKLLERIEHDFKNQVETCTFSPFYKPIKKNKISKDEILEKINMFQKLNDDEKKIIFSSAYQHGLNEIISNNMEIIINEVGLKEITRIFVTQNIQGNFRSDYKWIKLIEKFVNHYDNYNDYDYEYFEDLVSSILREIIKNNNLDLIKVLIVKATDMKAEEAIEKLMWALSKLPDESIDALERTIINVIDLSKDFEKPNIFIKIILLNILNGERIIKLPKLFERVINQIQSNFPKKWQDLLLSIIRTNSFYNEKNIGVLKVESKCSDIFRNINL